MNSNAISNLFGWLIVTGGIILALDGLGILDIPQIHSEGKQTGIVAAVLIVGGGCVAKA